MHLDLGTIPTMPSINLSEREGCNHFLARYGYRATPSQNARVEQLTKTTGGTILLTEQSVAALANRPPTLVDRDPIS
jgi:pyrroline-5-carboxylate reductase